MLHGSSATYGGMAHSVLELMVVLENLASGGRRGDSYACPGAASRVATWELLVWSPSVRRLEGWADGGPEVAQRRAWRCPSSRAPTVPGMTLQCLGWRHSGRDGHTRPDVTEETCSAGPMSRHRTGRARGRWPSPFEGSTALLGGVRRGGSTGVGDTVSWS
jgi:hypothetical protein